MAAWLMVAGALAAPASSSSPREVVQAAVQRVVLLLQEAESQRVDPEPRSRSLIDRRAEIRRVANDLFDFEEMARRTLTRHWTGRSRAEQLEFVSLFTALLERAYVGRIEAYSGERIAYLGESVDGGYATVRSRVITRRRTETGLDYRLHQRDGRWRVYDILIDGVSFVASYRSEFNRIIQTSSFGDLLEQLRKKRVNVVADRDRRG